MRFTSASRRKLYLQLRDRSRFRNLFEQSRLPLRQQSRLLLQFGLHLQYSLHVHSGRLALV